jgi:LysM repeat protein
MNRMLGFLMLFVVVGMFGFIAYKKMKEANFHFSMAGITASDSPQPGTTQPGAMQADSPKTENSETSAGTTASTSPADSTSQVASNSTGGTASPAASNPSAVGDPFGSSESAGTPGSPAALSPDAQPAKGPQPIAKDAVKTASAAAESNPFNDTPDEPSARKPASEPKAGASIAQAGPDSQAPFSDESATTQGGRSHKKSILAKTDTAASAPPVQTEPGSPEPIHDSFNPIADSTQAPPPATKVKTTAPEPPDSNPVKELASSDDSASQSTQREPGSPAVGHEPAPVTSLDSETPTTQAPTGIRSADVSGRMTAGKTTVRSTGAKPFNPNDDSWAEAVPGTPHSQPGPQTLPSNHLKASSKLEASGKMKEFAAGDTTDYYVVQPQDNFWTISRKKYGTSRYFMALAELNKTKVPDAHRLRPGIKVSTPPTDFLETNLHQFLPKGSTLQVTAEAEPRKKGGSPGFFIGAGGRPMYRTGEKDTLSNVAARHLGRSSRWIQLFEMNRDKLPNPNQLKVGTELALPGDASNVAVSTDVDDRR